MYHIAPNTCMSCIQSHETKCVRYQLDKIQFSRQVG